MDRLEVAHKRRDVPLDLVTAIKKQVTKEVLFCSTNTTEHAVKASMGKLDVVLQSPNSLSSPSASKYPILANTWGEEKVLESSSAERFIEIHQKISVVPLSRVDLPKGLQLFAWLGPVHDVS